jgi:hypothetical protein
VPDGVTVDAIAVEEVTPILQGAGVNQEQAQALVNWYANQQQQLVDSHNAQVEAWAEQSKNDPGFGGDKFDESVAVAKSALDKFGSPELKELLNTTGIGNHPAMIGLLVNLGNAMREDVPGATTRGTSAPQDRVSILYPQIAEG